MARIVVDASAQRQMYPVTADFRARLLERLETRGERARIVKDLGISYTALENLATGTATCSTIVPRICELYRWPAPLPIDKTRLPAAAEPPSTRVEEPKEEPAKERLVTGGEHVTTPMLMLELAARGHIVDGKVRLPVVEPDGPRPKTRGDCESGPRPCPWFACRHHLYRVDAIDRCGRRHWMGADAEAYVSPTGPESCALDVAERGAADSATVGRALGFTKERGRQLVEVVVPHVRNLLVAAGVDGSSGAEIKADWS
ncbi:MAG TPA: hypothetical protein VG963_12330 [Polyangiaceae bacterium]|nr:hypothetical protein [Polyangiaceae bacterium]